MYFIPLDREFHALFFMSAKKFGISKVYPNKTRIIVFSLLNIWENQVPLHCEPMKRDISVKFGGKHRKLKGPELVWCLKKTDGQTCFL